MLHGTSMVVAAQAAMPRMAGRTTALTAPLLRAECSRSVRMSRWLRFHAAA